MSLRIAKYSSVAKSRRLRDITLAILQPFFGYIYVHSNGIGCLVGGPRLLHRIADSFKTHPNKQL